MIMYNWVREKKLRIFKNFFSYFKRKIGLSTIERELAMLRQNINLLLAEQEIQQEIQYKINQLLYDVLIKYRQCTTSENMNLNNKIACKRLALYEPIEFVLEKLRNEAPVAFEVWQQAFINGYESYIGHPPDSCSVSGNVGAMVFKQFCEGRLVGNVLDIGCGNMPVPSYLDGYPTENIVGIDPLLPSSPHPFCFVQGYMEYLPFADDSFETVIMATSLDHALIPERALNEAWRVLKPMGKLLVWQGISENCIGSFEDYNPFTKESIFPIDKYHLFHFSKRSLIDFLHKKFVIMKMQYPEEANHVMIEALKNQKPTV